MMTLIIILPTLLILLIIYYLVPVLIKYRNLRCDYKNIFSLPLSPIPGIGNLHQLDKRQHVFSKFLMQMSVECQKQGQSLFCLWYSIWPMLFACRGKALVPFINHNKQLVKSFDYTLLEPWLKTGLLTSNNAKWRSRRRLITPSFHDNQLLFNSLNIFNEQSKVFVRRIGERIQGDKPGHTHDLFPYISTCTLDIIAETAMGEHVDAQTNDGNNEFVYATGRITQIINERVRSPWLWPSFIYNRTPLGREQAKVLNTLHTLSRRIIENRLRTFNSSSITADSDRTKKTGRLVFLDSLLSQMKTEQLTMDDIQEEVDTFMFAGHDTTSAAINFTCYLLGRHPDIQNKVQKELDAIFGGDTERTCTMEDLQEMTYLDQVIKESMRVLPPVPFIVREVQEDFISEGQIIRKGTTIYIFIMGIHYDADVFPQPEKFDPDRFSKDALTNDERSPFAFMPFSAGSRNCVGQRFALLEEKVILSTLLRHFSLGATQTVDDLQLSYDAVVRPTVPIQFHIEARSLS